MKKRSEERQKLIEGNVALVYAVVDSYIRKRVFRPDQREDAVEEGMIGLIYAADHYDASKGAKFSTAAYKMIQYYILDAVRKRECEKRRADKDTVSMDRELNGSKKAVGGCMSWIGGASSCETIGSMLPSRDRTDEAALEITLADVRELMDRHGISKKMQDQAVRMLLGETGREIAQTEGCTHQAVHYNFKKACAKIKGELREICGGGEDGAEIGGKAKTDH